jgi:hypothetical protein
MNNLSCFAFFAILCFVFSCKQPAPATDPNATSRLAIQEGVYSVFLNKTEATAAITSDTMTLFFENITTTDIALQFNKETLLESDSTSLRKKYQTYLAAQVLNFSAEEQLIINHSFQKIFSIFPKKQQNTWFPKNIYCIKVTGEGYGKQTYYTRNGCIIIPEMALQDALNGDSTEFERTLSHELFHIVSRYNTTLRTALYHRIGFDTIHNLLFTNDLLRKRMIENPDGTQAARIKLNDTTQGVLVCYSREPDFKLGADNFHTHFKWGMFQAKKQKNSAWNLITDSLGESTLSNTWEVSFFRQVGTNTEYIIHPDEILADNFALVVQKRRKIPITTEIDASGTLLLQDIERILFK